MKVLEKKKDAPMAMEPECTAPEGQVMAKREIACTAIGRNALVSGLICHVAALIAGMMSAPGVNQLIIYFYLFSCILLIGGGYAEFKHRSPALVKNGKFCLSAAATLFPLIGPMAALFLIYRTPVEGNDAEALVDS